MILKIPKSLVVLALILYQIIAAKTVLAFGLTNETDYQALLAFKSRITSDPLEALSSWNDSIHFCDWTGVTCGGRMDQRVTALNLTSLQLAGDLSPHLGNLSFLQVLNLDRNAFSGVIPQEVGRLSRLQTLSLVNNSFEGELPNNLTSSAELLVLNLAGNDLSGHIPNGLSALVKLTRLGLSTNRFSGEIPPSLGNLSALTHLYLAANRIEGSLPSELGNLSNLEFLQLSINNLSGHIPTTLFNISSIVMFSVAFNNLSGSLPSDIFITLPKLQEFYAGGNRFSGKLPTSIVNASELVMIDIILNSFAGAIPNLGGLKNLQLLSFGGNLLGTEEGDDLRFLTSLTNCTKLRLVWLPFNSLKGNLPDSIGNLSSTFTSLRLDQNLVSGTIPPSIGNLINLELLALYGNLLTGNIPNSIGRLSVLQRIFIHQNNISGTIPSSIGNIVSLTQLLLGENMLEGIIPGSIGNCTSLNELSLSQNQLTGTLPKELFGLSSLSAGLHLAQNHFTGPIPDEVGNLVNLNILDLSENNISGVIPPTVGSCVVLESLNLKGNQLSGTIPSSMRNLRGLELLDLSQNNFSGQIPRFLSQFPLMENLNLSFNIFEGQVPDEGVFGNISAVSVAGNNKLCGGPPILELPKCEKATKNDRRSSLPRRTVLAIGVSISTFLLLAGIISTVLYRSKRLKRKTIIQSSTENHLPQLSYAELSQATGGFSPENMIGEGSFGAVYKGVLPGTMQVVAVKVLKLEERGAGKSFMAECEALRNIRHRNLVKIITACSAIDYRGEDFKALVFELMPNGSLEKWLHPVSAEIGPEENSGLSLSQRLSIAIDVGTALDYLHHQCQVPIVHCDLKPSNVLINGDFTAHVGDFGLAKFLMDKSSETTLSCTIGIRGTIGYVAPEYGVGGEVSTRGDVYSFGILILELFTGKRTTAPMFSDNFGLRAFVKTSLPHELLQVVDPMLHLGGHKLEPHGSLLECLAAVLRVGLMCSASLPNDRLDIREAVAQLQKARAMLPVDI